MRKMIFCCLAVLILLCFASCFTNNNVLNISNNAPDLQGDYNSIDEISKTELQKIENETINIALLCRDIYMIADKGTAMNCVLSSDTVRHMVLNIGAQGYSVIDSDGEENMQNPQALIDFGNSINKNQDAEASYYVVYSDGKIGRFILSCKNGSETLIALQTQWNDSIEPEVYSEGEYSLLKTEYTEKGWLIYERDLSNLETNKNWNINPYTFVRVTPVDEACRDLCRKYIEPIGYLKNNLFTVSWDESDYGELSFNFLFQYLYGSYHNTGPLNYYSANEYYKLIEGTDIHLVPADEFEQITSYYFKISTSTLQIIAAYDINDNAYPIAAVKACSFTSVPKVPEPEVVDYWYNVDGSLTLVVDAVFTWYGKDCSFEHEVTIKETEDGTFKYKSNRLIASDANVFPDDQFGVTNEIKNRYN